MKTPVQSILSLAVVALVAGGCGGGETPTPTFTPTALPISSPIPEPTPTLTPEPTQSAETYYEQGRSLADSGDFEAALEAFAQAIELDSEYVQAYTGRMAIYMQLGDFEAALAVATCRSQSHMF